MNRAQASTLVFAGITALVTVATAFVAYRGQRAAFERELARRLSQLAELAASQVSPADLNDARVLGPDGNGLLALQLDALCSATGLANVSLLDDFSRVISDPRPPPSPHAPAPRAPGAERGVPAVPPRRARGAGRRGARCRRARRRARHRGPAALWRRAVAAPARPVAPGGGERARGGRAGAVRAASEHLPGLARAAALARAEPRRDGAHDRDARARDQEPARHHPRLGEAAHEARARGEGALGLRRRGGGPALGHGQPLPAVRARRRRGCGRRRTRRRGRDARGDDRPDGGRVSGPEGGDRARAGFPRSQREVGRCLTEAGVAEPAPERARG